MCGLAGFVLLWKFHGTLHSWVVDIFRGGNYHIGYTGWYIKAYHDGVRLPEIFTWDPILCLKVGDGILGDMLT